MKIANILPTTFADGERARTSIYFAGCDIQCEGCHNKDLWNINTGHEMSVNQIINYIIIDAICLYIIDVTDILN